MFNRSLGYFIFGLILLIILFFKSWIGIDTDFGWHLRLAEYVHLHGLPLNDPLSYTLASDRFIDMEWLYHLLLWPVYSVIGRDGLAVLFSLMALIPLLYIWKKYRWDGFLSILLLFSVFILRMGIRAEVYTWLLFFGLFLILQSLFLWKKYWMLLPLLMVLWTNLHGSFVLPILLVGMVSLVGIYSKQVSWLSGLLVMFLCLMVTFVNPYGYLLWQEALSHISQPLLKTSVMEWGRAYSYPEFAHIFALVVMSFFLYKYKSRFRIEEVAISVLLLVLSIGSLRLVPVFVLWSALILPRFIELLKEDFLKIPQAGERMIVFYRVLVIILLVFSGIESVSSLRTAYLLQEEKYYPLAAVSVLQKKQVMGNVFSIYEWGGYLDWKYPEKKVFIDGRVSGFRSVYGDYLNILEGKNVEAVFSKYNVRTVLLRSKFQKNELGLRNYLSSHGWKRVYGDDVAEIVVLGE